MYPSYGVHYPHHCGQVSRAEAPWRSLSGRVSVVLTRASNSNPFPLGTGGGDEVTMLVS